MLRVFHIKMSDWIDEDRGLAEDVWKQFALENEAEDSLDAPPVTYYTPPTENVAAQRRKSRDRRRAKAQRQGG